MKKLFCVLFMAVSAFCLNSCSDSDNYDPYKEQSIRPFYPTTVTFSSLNNEDTQTDKTWKLKYNEDNTIKSYDYAYKVKTKNGVTITEQHKGELTYYRNATSAGILNKLTVENKVQDITSTQGYSDIITEDVKIVAGKIESIKTIVQRTYLNGEDSTFSTMQTFSYSDKFCTGSILEAPAEKITYTYKWGNAQLNKITVLNRGAGNDINQETYAYTYNKKDLATDYCFNTLAFIYGNMPEIYAAMNLFGENTAYKLEGEDFSGYRTINNEQHDLSPISRNYSIFETANSVTYTADSPGTSTYVYTFSNN